jgi:catechol 2,3-dioxygenase-like lactoylglutathione lyase family enzyme
MPTIEQLVEAAIYVDDLDRAEVFYREALEVNRVAREPRTAATRKRAKEGEIVLLFPLTLWIE